MCQVEAAARCKVSKMWLVRHWLMLGRGKHLQPEDIVYTQGAMSEEAAAVIAKYRAACKALEDDPKERCCAEFVAPGR